MSNSLASAYAQALFDLAKDEGILDKILSQTQEIDGLIGESNELVKVLSTPTITKDEKKGVVNAVFQDSIHPYLVNCIKVMIDRNNADEMKRMFAEYEKLYNRFNNIEKAVAITAVPLTDDQSDRLRARLESVTGKKIVLTNRVDESLIGGITLEFEDRQYDDSIASKLTALKNQLKNN